MKLLFFLLAVALLPGLLSWWMGRSLLARRDDPALAERFLAHNTRVYSIAFGVMLGIGVALVFGGERPLASLVLMVPLLGTFAGGFPLRKALYEESWSFSTYFGFMLRLLVGVAGFWIALLLTPYAIKMAGDWRWIAAALLGTLLALWSHGFAALLVRITGARPLVDVEGRFAAHFARVDERSTVRAPERLVVQVPGGRLVNALALPSKKRSRVVFSSSLLELLEPEEVGAIYAHEVGHLEYFQEGHRLRHLGIFVYAMIAAAVAWGLVPWSDGLLAGFLWPVGFIVLMRLRNRWTRGHESDTDQRAVELFGDAEALIRGLTRLHQLMLMPRRLATETEEAMTHPSLARRLQSIRQAAGLDAEPEAESPGTASPGAESPAAEPDEEAPPVDSATAADPPLFLRSREEGVALLFEDERLSWFEGLPEELEDESPSFEALLRAATASRTQVYRGLSELRLEPRRGKAFLVVVDGQGEKRRFPLADDDVARLQRRLDTVDTHLGTEEKSLPAKTRNGARIFALVAALASLLPSVANAVAIPALFAIIKPRPVHLVVTGILGLLTCVYRLPRIAVHVADPMFTTAGVWILALASIPVLFAGIRWARQAEAEECARGAWPLAVTCWVLTLGYFAALYYLSLAGDTLDVFRLSRLLYWAPGAVLLPAAAALALFFTERRGKRFLMALSGGALSAGLVVLPLVASTTAFRGVFVDDPFVPDASAPSAERRDLVESARLELDVEGAALRLSPSGETWALCISKWAHCDSLSWRLGRVDGAALPEGMTAELDEVTDLLIVDEERFFVLRREEARGDSVFIIEKHGPGPGEPRAVRLPPIAAYEWHFSHVGESWALSIISYDEGSQLHRFAGGFADGETEETVWKIENPESGWSWGTAAAGDTALAVKANYGPANFGDMLSQNPEHELMAVSPGVEGRPLLRTRLDLHCKGLDRFPAALCIGHDRDRNYLWRVDLEGGARELLGSYRGPPGEDLRLSENGLLVGVPHGDFYWLDPDRLGAGDRSRLDGGFFELHGLPGGEGGMEAMSRLAVAGNGLLAMLQDAPDGRDGSLLVLYRFAEP